MNTNSIKANGLKGIFTKVVLAGAVAAAVFMAAPQKAEAQRIAFGVQIGHPGYYAPAPVYGPAYYGPGYDRGYYADRRHEEWVRHERWERDHRFYRGYYR